MSRPSEIANALYGIGRILRRDGTAWDYFAKTNEGFWHSYTAAFIAAPVFLAQTMMYYFERPDRPALAVFLVIQGTDFVLGWVLWPTVMMAVSRFLGKPDRFYAYMVAYNWFKLAEIVAVIPIAAMAAMGIFPPALVMALGVMTQAAFLFFEWYIARNGLGVPGITAVVLVLIDMQLFLMTGYLTGG